MRRVSLLVALLAALTLASSAGSATLFVIKGKGNGHGVGLSQWGSYGLAKGYAVDHPYTYQEILAHYYPGTSLAQRSDAKVAVRLATGRTLVRIRSGAEFRVTDGTRSVSHDAGTAGVTKLEAGRIKVEGIKGGFDSPVTFRPSTSPLRLDGLPYRGVFVASLVSGRLQVVNRLGLDPYVRGVVTLESPDSWGDEGAQAALEAQAVAARSYGLYRYSHSAGACQPYLCPDTRDQVYGGIRGESQNGDEAVAATRDRVVTYAGEVAETFFSSSSGGRTAASVDTWGGILPYLKSVADPADLNPSNYHRSWVVLRTRKQLKMQLSLAQRPSDAWVSDRASGRAREITAKKGSWSQTVSHSPTTSAFGSEYFRSALGLKSGRFWLGVQAITADKPSVECGEAVHLRVRAHDVGAISAEARSAGGSWHDISLTKIDATHWKATRRPCSPTDYRVVSAKATGPVIHVSVSAQVAFRALQDSGGLVGQTNLSLPGGTVTIERRIPHGWLTVAQAATASDGSFRASFGVTEGVYRARVEPAPATGFVTGYSRRMTVVFR